MLDIEDKGRQPDVQELIAYVDNPLFDELITRMQATYAPKVSVEYSGDKVLLGWNVKFVKAGRTLCRAYPRRGHFPLLLVVGQKEKVKTELLLPGLSEAFQKVYHDTQEGMGQRWLLFDVGTDAALLDNILAVVQIRRESR